MKTPHKLLLAASLITALGACAPTPAKPIAYRASSAQVIAAIAEVTPKLSTKLLNEPFRVVKRTSDSISVASHVPMTARIAVMFLGGEAGFGPGAEARIDFQVKDSGGLAYVTQTNNNAELYSRVNEVLDYLDSRFVRVKF